MRREGREQAWGSLCAYVESHFTIDCRRLACDNEAGMRRSEKNLENEEEQGMIAQ